jgi:hypothetical protein
MKIKFISIIIILILYNALYAVPVAGVSGILSNTTRGYSVASLIEQHILDILKKNSFDTIEAGIISRELAKFNCLEEKCILSFAENADIDLIIYGSVIDKKNSIEVKLEAYGINTPFNKRVINRYEIKIPLNGNVNIGSREFSLIGEEHAAKFISKTLNVFVHPIFIKNEKDEFILSSDQKISGRYAVYSKDRNNEIKQIAEADITENILKNIKGDIHNRESFILAAYKDKGDEISDYYDKRKREIVFEKGSIYDTLFLIAMTPIVSASMPVSSPLLGYYMNNDWKGLGLWMLNAPPYIYIEARGFINSPKRIKDRKEDVSQNDKAINHFAWYMLLVGGMPLFIDSYAPGYLNQASYFHGVAGSRSFMGSDASAAMLSLIGNGAGLFYRGERFWGYFYFHLNNILLFMTMREFSYPEYYNEISGRYEKGSRNKNRAITYCSLFVLSKAAEICHAVIAKENISSGEVIDEYIIPAPLFALDENGLPLFGISVTAKF